LIPVPNFFYTAIGYYGETLFKYQDFVEEIQAIADLAGLDFGEVFTLNFFYEITSWKMCTSVVARTDDNRIIHGRNLDFEFFRYFANLTAIIDYHKNGKLLFHCWYYCRSSIFPHWSPSWSLWYQCKWKTYRFNFWQYLCISLQIKFPSCLVRSRSTNKRWKLYSSSWNA